MPIIATIIVKALIFVVPLLIGLVMPTILIYFTDWGKDFFAWVTSKSLELVVSVFDYLVPLDDFKLQDKLDTMPADVINVLGMLKLDVVLSIYSLAFITYLVLKIQIETTKALLSAIRRP